MVPAEARVVAGVRVDAVMAVVALVVVVKAGLVTGLVQMMANPILCQKVRALTLLREGSML